MRRCQNFATENGAGAAEKAVVRWGFRRVDFFLPFPHEATRGRENLCFLSDRTRDTWRNTCHLKKKNEMVPASPSQLCRQPPVVLRSSSSSSLRSRSPWKSSRGAAPVITVSASAAAGRGAVLCRTSALSKMGGAVGTVGTPNNKTRVSGDGMFSNVARGTRRGSNMRCDALPTPEVRSHKGRREGLGGSENTSTTRNHRD